MNKDIIGGKWEQFAGKVKGEWGKITDDDLKKAEGDMEVVYGKLREMYGWDEEEEKEQRKKWDAFIEDFFK